MNDSLSIREDISESDLMSSNLPYTKRKILILGGQEVGKTSIIRRFKNNIYIEEYEPTIQNLTKKTIMFNNECVYLELMDLDGQTEYTIFSPNKFSFGYNGYILVYNVRDMKSFELIQYIYEQISFFPGNTSKILIGTKSDKDLDNSNQRQVSTEIAKKFADKINCPFLEISSKDNINIEEIFRLLIIEINKTESGVNLEQIKFIKIFKFFLHHPKLMIYLFYINLLILIILSIVIFFIGIFKEFIIKEGEENNYYFGIGFPYIVFGIWGILINVGGIVGMRNKDTFLLGLNFLGLIYGGIFCFISIFQIYIINNYLNLTSQKIIENIWLFIIILIPLIIGIIFSSIYEVLIQKDLKSYMA